LTSAAGGGSRTGVLGAIIAIVVSGFVIGALARWGVPGPDPMPWWLTVLFGLGGSVLGGGSAAAALGANQHVSSADYFTILLASVLAAMVLIILYRRLIQKRPITGPEARKPPSRGIGITTLRSRRELTAETKAALLRHLDELHDQGVLSDEEYVEKRRKVLRGEP
jgi:uncharacterized membrane protein YeaQ/YmgE (transglycosylase-associated protein family)